MKYKERLNVIKCESGGYSAHLVNIPLVVEGISIEDVKVRAKRSAKEIVNMWQELLNEDEPFEVIEFDDLNEWLTKGLPTPSAGEKND